MLNSWIKIVEKGSLQNVQELALQCAKVATRE